VQIKRYKYSVKRRRDDSQNENRIAHRQDRYGDYLRIIGKLCSGSCGGAILPPDADIATVGARKVKNSNSKNRGGLILTRFNLATVNDSGLVFAFSDLNIASKTSIVNNKIRYINRFKHKISANLSAKYQNLIDKTFAKYSNV
jgi:hypothetical protein